MDKAGMSEELRGPVLDSFRGKRSPWVFALAGGLVLGGLLLPVAWLLLRIPGDGTAGGFIAVALVLLLAGILTMRYERQKRAEVVTLHEYGLYAFQRGRESWVAWDNVTDVRHVFYRIRLLFFPVALVGGVHVETRDGLWHIYGSTLDRFPELNSRIVQEVSERLIPTFSG